MKDIASILKSIGFTDSETKTYLMALEHGPETVIHLSKRTNLSRQTTYLAIEGLVERSLMTSLEHNGKKFYAAESPTKLLAYAKRHDENMRARLNDLTKLIPELDLKTSGERPIVKMYEGREGVLTMIREMEETSVKEAHEITDLETLYRVLTKEDLKPLRDKREHAGLRVHGMYAGATETPFLNADARLLPPELWGFHGNISVFGDKTLFVSFEGKMHSMIIESKAIANTLRILFRLSARSLAHTAETSRAIIASHA